MTFWFALALKRHVLAMPVFHKALLLQLHKSNPPTPPNSKSPPPPPENDKELSNTQRDLMDADNIAHSLNARQFQQPSKSLPPFGCYDTKHTNSAMQDSKTVTKPLSKILTSNEMKFDECL